MTQSLKIRVQFPYVKKGISIPQNVNLHQEIMSRVAQENISLLYRNYRYIYLSLVGLLRLIRRHHRDMELR